MVMAKHSSRNFLLRYSGHKTAGGAMALLNRRATRNVLSLAAWAIILAVVPAAIAGGIDDKDFSLRLPAALSRFSTYADVGAVGGASAGSKWASSVNPASTAWLPVAGELDLTLTLQYADIQFGENQSLHVASQAVTVDAGEVGVLLPAFAQVRSNQATTRQGLDFRFDLDMVQVQWAKKFSDDFAIGANVNFAKSRTQFDFGVADVSDSAGETYGFRFGALHQMADHLLGGLVFDYTFSRDRTTLYDFLGLGIGNARIKDTTHQFILRPGVSYEYKKDSAVYLDYQFASFCNDTGRLQVHRFPMGVDHSVFAWLFVRGGVMIDLEGSVAWTTGVGIYPSDRFSIDVMYQDDMFPELNMEFGRSRTLMVSVSINF